MDFISLKFSIYKQSNFSSFFFIMPLLRCNEIEKEGKKRCNLKG